MRHFVDRGDGRRRIAVVGAGIAGLSAAWLLSRRHEVVLYEKNTWLGGHANTLDVLCPEGRVSVDTGFIVFNQRNYPNFTALLEHLGVASIKPTCRSACRSMTARFEYSSDLLGIFGQPAQYRGPRFWRMLGDILHFYGEANRLAESDVAGCRLGDFLSMRGYSQALVDGHVLPMCAAIWSTTTQQMREYPMRAFLRFFSSHGLLQLFDKPQWRSVAGGSRAYVQAMRAQMAGQVQFRRGAMRIMRSNGLVEIEDADGAREIFTDLVIGAHADEALELLADPSENERGVLGAFRYTDNLAVLHDDRSLMPHRRATWGSWNYIGGARQRRGVAALRQLLDEPAAVVADAATAVRHAQSHPAAAACDCGDRVQPSAVRHRSAAGAGAAARIAGRAQHLVLRQLFRLWLPRGRASVGPGGGRSARYAGALEQAADAHCRGAACCRAGGMRSAIYAGTVIHTRLRPKRHRLSYRVFSLLLDLDEIATLDSRVLGIERAGLLGFRAVDHGDGVTPLRDWATLRLAEAGIDWDGGRIELLCYPRMLGFVFNPLSVWFCYARSGELRGILHEVHNTHGERHTYVMAANPVNGEVRHTAAKRFFVSPFMPPEALYRFRIVPAADEVVVSIVEHDAAGPLLAASFSGKREALTDRALLGLLLRYPLMTLKVVAGIHWEALKLVVKGFRVYAHTPAARRIDHSVPARAKVKVTAE